MKASRKTLIGLFHLFDRLGNIKSSVKFHFKGIQNKRMIKPLFEDLQQAQQPIPEHQEYEKKRIDLCKKFANKNEDGSAILLQQRTPEGQLVEQFQISDKEKEEFDAKLKELQEGYKDALEKFEQRTKEFQDLLDEEIDMELHKFKMSELPETLMGSDVEMMFELIDED